MTKTEEDELAHWMQGKDVTEVLAVLMRSGNRYNRRILKFFKWFCKYVPVVIMLTHMYGMIEFARHPREMVVTLEGNEPCYAFIYAMVYVLPHVPHTCKQILLAMLEIQDSVLLFSRSQCDTYMLWQYIYD